MNTTLQTLGEDLAKAIDNRNARMLTPSKKKPPITEGEQIAKCRKDVERFINESGYDHTGIVPKDWDVLMEIAGRRKAISQYKDLSAWCDQNGFEPPEPVKRNRSGVIIMGVPGCGKTMLLNLLNKAGAFPAVYGEVSLALSAETGGVDSVFKKYKGIETGDVSIDDVGLIGNIKTYGNSNLIDKIILYRYEMWLNHGYTTYFTTNISSYQDFVNRFCTQIADRVFEMCYHVIIQGGSKRVSAKARWNE